jgi:CheY-like chemotaxis protein
MSEQREMLNGRRVLIVEDEMVVAMLLEDMLEELGCQVAATAARVPEALAAIEAIEIDAAILDVNLDGTRSYSVADALTARGIPLVFSTGYGVAAFEQKYRHHPILAKPFRIDDLADALEEAIAPAGGSS